MTVKKKDLIVVIHEWVGVVLSYPEVKLEKLELLSTADLRMIALALDTAGTKWMEAVVHEAMKK